MVSLPRFSRTLLRSFNPSDFLRIEVPISNALCDVEFRKPLNGSILIPSDLDPNLKGWGE
jgi:hypothetical protein